MTAPAYDRYADFRHLQEPVTAENYLEESGCPSIHTRMAWLDVFGHEPPLILVLPVDVALECLRTKSLKPEADFIAANSDKYY